MDYTTYIKPELLVLIPALIFVGYCLKTSAAVKDKLIPALLAAVGVVLAAVYVLATTNIAAPQDGAQASVSCKKGHCARLAVCCGRGVWRSNR